ncbi:hypothetical protein [Gordonia otitidis]|uniref:hypothetical protein n=1 Tax=Gordonia otitidis TaxID=249058 RepID=UPI0002F73270|nr:hypothetical protein [Gordonia otitidis]
MLLSCAGLRVAPHPAAPDDCEGSTPLGVRATLRSATIAATQGDDAAIARLHPDIATLFSTADCAEGMASFVERRDAQFTGH